MTLTIKRRAEGLYVEELDLYLDPHDPVPRAFFSHAHVRQRAVRQSHTVFGSYETLALAHALVSGACHPQVLGWDGSFDLANAGLAARLSIAPAGHMVGAAQLVVDHPGGRLVYTGDYALGNGALHAPGEPVVCDDLIIESAFALPIFHFPKADAVLTHLMTWVAEQLADAKIPVMVAGALGTAQELVHASLERQIPILASEEIFGNCQAYEALGVELGVGDRRLNKWTEAPGVDLPGVLLVSSARASKTLRRVRPDVRVAYVSGWALLDAPLERALADAGFPLSDHAGHDDLLATVRATGARRVITTHGDSEDFAMLLNDCGISAVALDLPATDGNVDALGVP